MKYCVIGAGLAGIGVCHRLAENPNNEVILIEDNQIASVGKLNRAQLDPYGVDRFIYDKYSVLSLNSWFNLFKYPNWIINYGFYRFNLDVNFHGISKEINN